MRGFWLSSQTLGVKLLLMLALVVQGCAHQRTNDTSADYDVEQDAETPMVKLQEVKSFHANDPEPPKVYNSELDSIPVEINPLVEKWIAYFQGKGRPHMERYLSRSTRYSKLMKRILRQNGLPEDLIYIALIESGFASHATSRAAAVGYWQFIRGTGKRYGLEISPLVDERRDPVLATQAAAEYFKGLYSVFGSWYLAMASYNVGENRVKREVMKNYTRDFWELARKRSFPHETVNYVPKFIAAKMIGNNPEKYGFTNIDYMTPIEFEHVKITKPVNLKQMAAAMGMDYDDLKNLNPKFKGEVAPLKGTTLELRIPPGQQALAIAAADKAVVTKVQYVADAGDTSSYKVRSGDSLYSIARKYRTTVAWLRDVNELKKGRTLRIGQRIQVPDRGGKVVVKAVAKAEQREDVEKASAKAEIVTKGGVFYVVQAGDTLSHIADDYNSSIDELRKMNKMTRKSVLRAGMKLKVPKDDGLPSDPSGTKDAKTEEVADNDADTETQEPRVASAREPQSITQQTHVVRSGENLTVIAKKYGVSVQQIQKANKLTRRSVLKVGSRLVIPGNARQESSAHRKYRKVASVKTKPKYHVVKRGENLSLIANRYRVSVGTLKKQNNLKGGSKLYVGSKILIPVASAQD